MVATLEALIAERNRISEIIDRFMSIDIDTTDFDRKIKEYDDRINEIKAKMENK